MRIVLVSAALLMLSACGGEPLPGGVLPPPDMAARPPAPVVAQARPLPVAKPAPLVAEARPLPVVPAPAPVVPRLAPVPLAAAPPREVVLAPAAPPPAIAVRPAPSPAAVAVAPRPAPPPAAVAMRPARLPVTLVTTAPPPRAAARLVPAAAIAAPPPAPAPSPAIVPAVFVPRWTGWFTGHPPASPGRMTLSNFTFGLAHVEALITPYPDCVVRTGMVPIDIKLPLNSTWIISAPPGRDVCWRRKLERIRPGAELTVAPGGWGPWNRVFTSFGHSVDARL
ncbi:MAG TPA: hypothetical protein VFX06_15530 [Stellaceae bacterium]|nr:hypothetical protein [Stellaceae bacterium]